VAVYYDEILEIHEVLFHGDGFQKRFKRGIVDKK
jgi:hypothetical protein